MFNNKVQTKLALELIQIKSIVKIQIFYGIQC